MAKNEVEEKESEDEEVAPKKGLSTMKIVIIAIVATLLLGGGLVGGTLYFVNGMNDDQSSSSSKKAKKSQDADEDGEEEEDEEEGDDEEDEEVVSLEPPQYHSMDPKFVVSFNDQKSARFMQFSLEIMSRDAEVVKKIEAHMPAVRSSLLMLFGGQEYDSMVSREGKQKLLKEVAVDINKTLVKMTGEKNPESTVEAAYFTSFVIQ